MNILTLFTVLIFSQLSWGQMSLKSWIATQPVSGSSNQLSYASADGGADTGGGGSGVWVDGKLRLKDFANCPGVKDSPLGSHPEGIKISEGILRLDSQSIRNLLDKPLHSPNVLLHNMILAGSFLANWYVVDADLYLDHKNEQKIAIFKRSIGIMMDRRQLAQLSDVDIQGLLFHETLRMVALGFGVSLKTNDIEEITCQVYSGQKLEVDRYPMIKDFIQYLLTDPILQFRSHQQAIRFWENAFAVMAGAPATEPVRTWLPRYYRQRDQSKFETLRKLASNPEHLRRAFFTWAAQQAPQDCLTIEQCNYHEEWQNSRVWDLMINTADTIGWRDRSSKQEWVASKKVYPQSYASRFCRNLGDGFKSLTRAELGSLKSTPEAGLLMNRIDLNEIEFLGFPFFLDLNNVQLMIWYQTINSSMDPRFSFSLPLADGKARIFCINANNAR